MYWAAGDQFRRQRALTFRELMDAETPNQIERKWWTAKKKSAHSPVFSLTSFLRKH